MIIKSYQKQNKYTTKKANKSHVSIECTAERAFSIRKTPVQNIINCFFFFFLSCRPEYVAMVPFPTNRAHLNNDPIP